MGNQQVLVHNDQHIIDNRFYVIEVFKGQAYRNAEYTYKHRTYEKIVLVPKVFSIVISEIIMEDGKPNKVHARTFPNCTARTGDFMTAIAAIKEQCNKLLDIEFLMASYEKRFSVALNREAVKVLKKEFGLHRADADFTVTISTKDFPLPRK